MEFRELGRTGLRVSSIGFGGIPIQQVAVTQAKKILNHALDKGINFFDTARVYSDSENKFGCVLGRRRDECIISTRAKVYSREEMEKEIQTSLRNLKTDFIDLYEIHTLKNQEQLKFVLSDRGAMAALKEAQADGKIRFIGVTGHQPGVLLEAIKTGFFDAVMFPFNYIEYSRCMELLNHANKMNLGIIVMKPLAGGALRNAGAALKFILQYPVSVVIPGTNSIAQIDENVSSQGNLTLQEKKELEENKKRMSGTFCRQCGYCMPSCPKKIPISTILCFDAYYERYGMKGWARERYKNSVDVKADKCTECGSCESNCPYGLPIISMLKNAHKNLGEK
ncbi:aldo/keto reductase [Candidatus Woesearchaeota archaeon]|nr:aldo/keto reductase [Candidatus Woesearchaeota archaeon]